MIRSVLVVVLGVLAPAAPAAADVRVLAEREHLGAPVLDGGRVVYGDGSRRALTVFEQPAAGGAAVALARVAVPRPSWELDRSAAGLAVRMGPLRGARRLLAGPPQGPLAFVQRRPREGPAPAEERDLFAAPGGPLVLERTDRLGERLRAVLRPPGGPARVLATPAGADLHHLMVAGAVAAVAVPERGEIVLLDLPSGTIRDRRPMGDFAGTALLGLAVSETGDIALTVQDGLGTHYLGWMPAGAAEPRVVLAGAEFGQVSTAAGHIAMQQPVMRGDAARVVVLDPSGDEPRVLFRGPPTAYVRGLDFDGQHVAWATDGCQLVADVDSPQVDVIPRGPCVRTDAAFTLELPSSVRVRVRCVATPGRRCRIDLRVYGRFQQRLARRLVLIPRGRERTVKIPLRTGGVFVVYGRVIDPDERRRIAVVL